MKKNELGRNIQLHRIEKKLTQEKLAEILGISTVFISKIENGARLPGLALLVNIANVLSVSVDELLGSQVHATSKARASELNKMIQHLTHTQQCRVYTVIKAIIEFDEGLKE